MSKELLTRNDCRKLGLDYTNTTFQRWESPKYGFLTPVKPPRRSCVVRYHREEVEKLLSIKIPDTF
jgi:hypothetical protein